MARSTHRKNTILSKAMAYLRKKKIVSTSATLFQSLMDHKSPGDEIPFSRDWNFSKAYKSRRRSFGPPHQGDQEKARRRNQISRGIISMDQVLVTR